MNSYHNNAPRKVKSGLTKRALDAGVRRGFSSSFLAWSFSCSQIESTPAPAPSNANRWAPANINTVIVKGSYEQKSWASHPNRCNSISRC